MRILIIKDSATKIPREVAGMDDVRAIRAQGFEVEVVGGEPADEARPAEQAAAEPEAPAAEAEPQPEA